MQTLTGASSKFIGYYVSPSSNEALYAGADWVTISSQFAGDCPAGGPCTTIGTGCQSGTLTYNGGGTLACGGGFLCFKMTIFASYPSVLPSAYNFACRAAWPATVVYKDVPATVTPSSSAISSQTPSPASTTQSMPSITSAPSQTFVKPPSVDLSKARVAGAVIGPLIFITLFSIAIVMYRKRRAHRAAAVYELGDGAADQSTVKYVYEKDARAAPVELSCHIYRPQELGGTAVVHSGGEHPAR